MEWFRFYTRTLESRKAQALSPSTFKGWVNLLCLASIYEGTLPDFPEIAFRLRCSDRQVEELIAQLEAANLIDRNNMGRFQMHDWNEHQYVSDNSTQRVKKHREKQRRNVSVTPPDTDSEQTQNRTDSETEKSPLPPPLPPPLPSQTEWPLTTAELVRHDPATDQMFVLRLVQKTFQDLISAGDMEMFDDEDMATAIKESYNGYHGKRAHGNGLLLNRVPQIMLNWGKNDQKTNGNNH